MSPKSKTLLENKKHVMQILNKLSEEGVQGYFSDFLIGPNVAHESWKKLQNPSVDFYELWSMCTPWNV